MLKLQTHILGQLKDGAVLRDVYNNAVEYIRNEKPELEPHFLKTMGFSVSFYCCW